MVTGLTGETVVAVEIETVPEPEPEVVPEPVAEPEPEVEPAVADVVAEPEPTVEPAVAVLPPSPEPVVEPEPAAAVPAPEADPAPEPGAAARKAAAVDPAGWFAAVTAFVGVVLVVTGMFLEYRHGYLLGQYRPGMQQVVTFVAACALLGVVLTLVPRTRARTGPAVLLGAALAAVFGLARFLGEATTLSQPYEDSGLAAGFTLELLGHIALVAVAPGALTVLRRNPADALRAAKVEGRTAWAVIALGVTIAAGWITQLVELTVYDSDDGGRAAAYFVLGALLAVAVTGAAAILRPAAVGRAVLAVGIAALAGVMVPTFDAIQEHSSLTQTGQVIAAMALVVLAIVAVVQSVRARRNQPIGRQP